MIFVASNVMHIGESARVLRAAIWPRVRTRESRMRLDADGGWQFWP